MWQNKSIKQNAKEKIINTKKKNETKELKIKDEKKKSLKNLNKNNEEEIKNVKDNSDFKKNQRKDVFSKLDKKNVIDTKNNILNDVDSNLKKKNLNCLNYAYKNYNDTKNKNIKFSKDKNKNKTINDIFSFEKKKENDLKVDINSLIYDTFINTNLKTTLNDTKTKKTYKKNKNLNVTKSNENTNYTEDNKIFNDYKTNLSKILKDNLIAPTVEKEYRENFTQVNEIENKCTQIENNKKKIVTKKTISIQTDIILDELNSLSIIWAKKIINEAYIQIAYVENLKILNKTKQNIQTNEQINKEILNNLIDKQKENIQKMKENNQIMKYINIFKKIHMLDTSHKIVNLLLNNNITNMKKNENNQNVEEIKWHNEIIKLLIKNTSTFLSLEKMISFITEEAIENSFLNYCLSDEHEIIRFNEYLNNRKIYLHKKRKIEKGLMTFILDYENNKNYISIKINKTMNIKNIKQEIKKVIKNFPSIDKYNLDLIEIKSRQNIITDITQLYMSEPDELMIFIKK